MKYDNQGNFAEVSDREMVHTAKKWGFIALALLIVLPLVVWGLSVAFAPIAGKGNVRRQINAPNNIIFQYEHFFTLDGDIKTDATSLHNAQTQAAKAGHDSTEQARLDSIVTGLANHCAGLVNQYNNDAREYTKEQFLSNKLPDQEDRGQCTIS